MELGVNSVAGDYVLENAAVRLVLHKETLRGEIRLKANGEIWYLDIRESGGWSTAARSARPGTPSGDQQRSAWESLPLPEAVRIASDELAFVFERGTARLRASIRLLGNDSAIEFAASPLSWGDGAVSDLIFPGSVYQETRSQAVVPTLQGLLYSGRGGSFEEYNPFGGLRMRWWGVLGERSSYIAIIETPDDAGYYIAADGHGRLHTRVRWLASLGELAYERRVLYHFKPGVTSYVPLAKHFRAYARSNGLFKSLREKIEGRPALERLIGAAHVFLGYQAGDNFDYLGALRSLKKLGVERALCFPFYFCNWGTPFVINGVASISQRHLVETVQNELGYLCSPWAWNFEMLTRDPDYAPELILKRNDGSLAEHWRIEKDVWQIVSPRKATELYKKYESDFMLCDAFHFDVTTSHALMEDHDARRPITRSEDRRARTDMFRWLTDRGKVVGSEGFYDWAAPTYDYGTTKLGPNFGDGRFRTIPLMGLVYHDAVIHAWWEVDAYNELHPFYEGRGGNLIHQSLQDILYNDPPLIFPIGRQYYWADRKAKRVEYHAYDLTTPGVAEATERAIAVARLHRAHALEEMTEHRFLSPDGSVQETAFASGTRITVNFATQPAETSDGRPVAPLAWQVSGEDAR